MSFGRKIANRILVATTGPLAVMFLAGCIVAYASGSNFSIYRYALSQLVVMLAVVILHGVFNRRLAVRLSRLVRTAERIDSGDLSARLPEDEDADEFSELGRALNKMADILASREIALREQNHALAGLNSRMESVLNTTNDGIALFDHRGCITLANRRFGELLGVRSDYLLNRTVEEILPKSAIDGADSPLAARLVELGRTAVDRTIGVAEETIEVAVNRPGALDASSSDRAGTPRADDPDVRFVQIYTAPVLAEDGHEWIGRIVALHDATREYELDKMKSEFISVVSHELRTPLTSIRAYTDLMISGDSGEISELQREFLGYIQSSTSRLSNLISDVLDISRIESGRIKIRFEPVDYLSIVTDVLRLMKASADEKQIILEASLPESLPAVRGDADKINQVLSNLVNNAVKYTPAGGWIKVSVEVTDAATVSTCVADSGIGISQDDQKKLFQKFFRADNSSTREAGGTGLGLVITKTIVEMLGGAIWVESEPAKGSRFYYTLPLHQDTGAPVTENVLLPDRGIGLILLVDDNVAVRDALQHHLHRRGYGAITASTAAETLQRARQHRPDAILLNIMIGRVEGVDVLRALKEDRATASLPLVLTSIVSDPSRGILSMGALSLVQHPYENDRLLEALTGLLQAVRSGAHGRRVLLIPGAEAAQNQISTLRAKLASQNVGLTVASSFPDALAATISESPNIIIIDTSMSPADLAEIMGALKVEEEAARIPIILLSEDISDAFVFRHAGSQAVDSAGTLDYVYEQLTRVMADTGEPAQ